MIVFLLGLLFLAAYKIKFHKFNGEYISKEQTSAIKGICAILILLSHLYQYVTPQSAGDRMLQTVLGHVGQLSVVAFFFYSGFGIYKNITKRKDGGYFKGFFKKRFFRILLKFDFFVLLFVLLNIVFSIEYEPINYIFCWIGITQIGNSSWFIFAILLLYLFVFIAFRWSRNTQTYRPILIVAALTFLYCIVFYVCGKETWWYDTVLCFPFGMLYAMHEERLKVFFQTHYGIGLAVLVIVFAALCVLKNVITYMFFIPLGCVLCVIILAINMKVAVYNVVLDWLGKHSLSIFVLQRVPMIVLSQLQMQGNTLLFSIIVIAATLVLAQVMDFVFEAAYNHLTITKDTIKKGNGL